MQRQQNAERSSTNSDNQGFLTDVSCFKQFVQFNNKTKDIVFYFIGNNSCCWVFKVANQVLAGEGVNWLKQNRLKKLMEDESYRDFMVTKLNRGLNRKISPDDHIDDVVSHHFIKAINQLLSD